MPTIFQSTPSIRRATSGPGKTRCSARISIHALHTEGDGPERAPGPQSPHFNPRPPYGGRPPADAQGPTSIRHFNPRPPYGGRPALGRVSAWAAPHFNPRPPYGGRRAPRCWPGATRAISIHALHTEGDCTRVASALTLSPFQSTPSIRRATSHHTRQNSNDRTFQSTPSIRRATRPRACACRSSANFNPRPPYGGRL